MTVGEGSPLFPQGENQATDHSKELPIPPKSLADRALGILAIHGKDTGDTVVQTPEYLIHTGLGEFSVKLEEANKETRLFAEQENKATVIIPLKINAGDLAWNDVYAAGEIIIGLEQQLGINPPTEAK